MNQILQHLLTLLDGLLPLSIGLAITFSCIVIVLKALKRDILLGLIVFLCCFSMLCFLFLFL